MRPRRGVHATLQKEPLPAAQEIPGEGRHPAHCGRKTRLHSSEESRWDFRVVLVFKNQQAAFDPNLTEPYKKLLYPDLEKLKNDEQYRFTLLEAHWDVMTQNVNLDQ